MAWRNQGITGSNNIPLGKRRFAGDGEEDGVANGGASPNGFAHSDRDRDRDFDRDVKRGRSPERTFSRFLSACAGFISPSRLMLTLCF